MKWTKKLFFHLTDDHSHQLHIIDILRRLTVYGCECGFVKLAVVDLKKEEIVSCWSARFEGPVSTLRLFTEATNIKSPNFIELQDTGKKDDHSVHLLVSCTLQSSMVYICKTGNSLCVIHGYSQEVLVYKYQEGTSEKQGKWMLKSQRSFANPIHSIQYLDVTGDGVKEFVILTLRGVHIMQVRH
ncbi:Kaptin [Blattella germanica]|nr:Kaptin [Blattella germanica]